MFLRLQSSWRPPGLGLQAVESLNGGQPGIIAELADRLADVRQGDYRRGRAVLVVPLLPGASERARSLVTQGPPFDPQAVGLDRHEVFVTEKEAIFLFEAPTPATLDRLLGEDGIWEAAGEWRDVMAGPPQLADTAYTWERLTDILEGLSFEPSPGPGDSEGGDLFSPES